MAVLFFWILSGFAIFGWGLDTKNLVIIILSQGDKYHLELAENLRNNLHEQADNLQKERPIVHLSHSDFPHIGHWTILPILPKLSNLHKTNSSWMFFVEDRTKIKLKELLILLEKYNETNELFIGHALYDNEATIIHHFAFYENPQFFKYPNIASGFAVTTKLINILANRFQLNWQNSDFSIDYAHELALFIWNKGKGHNLQHECKFCIEDQTECATYPKPFQQCGDLVPKQAIYFAVKTCQKFHKDRVPIVKHTWAQHVSRIKFFSDLEDSSIPTITLNIPNTEQGHCGKTFAILRYLKEEIQKQPEIKWVIIVDDDTILGVSRLQQILSCYDSHELIALGERYGFNVLNTNGYNYITGGGGMVFSRTLLQELLNCECPSNNTPDDMFLGMCIARMGLAVTHSPLFHQARPIDYSSGYLSTNDAVSFHKHWMIDPINVYNKWFAEDDLKSSKMHDEL